MNNLMLFNQLIFIVGIAFASRRKNNLNGVIFALIFW